MSSYRSSYTPWKSSLSSSYKPGGGAYSSDAGRFSTMMSPSSYRPSFSGGTYRVKRDPPAAPSSGGATSSSGGTSYVSRYGREGGASSTTGEAGASSTTTPSSTAATRAGSVGARRYTGAATTINAGLHHHRPTTTAGGGGYSRDPSPAALERTNAVQARAKSREPSPLTRTYTSTLRSRSRDPSPAGGSEKGGGAYGYRMSTPKGPPPTTAAYLARYGSQAATAAAGGRSASSSLAYSTAGRSGAGRGISPAPAGVGAAKKVGVAPTIAVTAANGEGEREKAAKKEEKVAAKEKQTVEAAAEEAEEEEEEEESSEEDEEEEEDGVGLETFIAVAVTTRATSPTPPSSTSATTAANAASSTLIQRTRRFDIAKTLERTIQRSTRRRRTADKAIQSDRMDDSTRYSRFSSRLSASTSPYHESRYSPSSASQMRYSASPLSSSGRGSEREQAASKSPSAEPAAARHTHSTTATARTASPHKSKLSPPKVTATGGSRLAASSRPASTESLSAAATNKPPAGPKSDSPPSRGSPPQATVAPSGGGGGKLPNKDFRKSALNVGPTDRPRKSRTPSSGTDSEGVAQQRRDSAGGSVKKCTHKTCAPQPAGVASSSSSGPDSGGEARRGSGGRLAASVAGANATKKKTTTTTMAAAATTNAHAKRTTAGSAGVAANEATARRAAQNSQATVRQQQQQQPEQERQQLQQQQQRQQQAYRSPAAGRLESSPDTLASDADADADGDCGGYDADAHTTDGGGGMLSPSPEKTNNNSNNTGQSNSTLAKSAKSFLLQRLSSVTNFFAAHANDPIDGAGGDGGALGVPIFLESSDSATDSDMPLSPLPRVLVRRQAAAAGGRGRAVNGGAGGVVVGLVSLDEESAVSGTITTTNPTTTPAAKAIETNHSNNSKDISVSLKPEKATTRTTTTDEAETTSADEVEKLSSAEKLNSAENLNSAEERNSAGKLSSTEKHSPARKLSERAEEVADEEDDDDDRTTATTLTNTEATTTTTTTPSMSSWWPEGEGGDGDETITSATSASSSTFGGLLRQKDELRFRLRHIDSGESAAWWLRDSDETEVEADTLATTTASSNQEDEGISTQVLDDEEGGGEDDTLADENLRTLNNDDEDDEQGEGEEDDAATSTTEEASELPTDPPPSKPRARRGWWGTDETDEAQPRGGRGVGKEVNGVSERAWWEDEDEEEPLKNNKKTVEKEQDAEEEEEVEVVVVLPIGGAARSAAAATPSRLLNGAAKVRHADSGQRDWWLAEDDQKEDEEVKPSPPPNNNNLVVEATISLPPRSAKTASNERSPPAAGSRTATPTQRAVVENGGAEEAVASTGPRSWWLADPIKKLFNVRRVESGERAWWQQEDDKSPSAGTTPSPAKQQTAATPPPPAIVTTPSAPTQMEVEPREPALTRLQRLQRCETGERAWWLQEDDQDDVTAAAGNNNNNGAKDELSHEHAPVHARAFKGAHSPSPLAFGAGLAPQLSDSFNFAYAERPPPLGRCASPVLGLEMPTMQHQQQQQHQLQQQQQQQHRKSPYENIPMPKVHVVAPPPPSAAAPQLAAHQLPYNSNNNNNGCAPFINTYASSGPTPTTTNYRPPPPAQQQLFISRHHNIDELLGGSCRPISPYAFLNQHDHLLAQSQQQFTTAAAAPPPPPPRLSSHGFLEEITPDQVRIHDSTAQLPFIQRMQTDGENGGPARSEWPNYAPYAAQMLDDAAIQVYKDGDYGAYLDLESSLAEQTEEIEGLNSSRKNSLVVRTQLSVRVHAIIEKLRAAEGSDLRRALFSLKQVFQEDKDLVHAFVALGGLNCLVSVGNGADQNYQNYILRALGQVMLYVDGMNGVMKHQPTMQWLYSLIASSYRSVVKTSLKLLLVFVEYAEANCYALVNVIHAVDQSQGRAPWTNIMRLLKDYDNADAELVIYATSLINKTLAGLSDQDSFYDESDLLEQQGMESVIQRYLAKPGTDLDLIDQLQMYEAVLKFEDGESDGMLLPDHSVRKTQRHRPGATSTERRKSRRHSTGTSPAPPPLAKVLPPVAKRMTTTHGPLEEDNNNNNSNGNGRGMHSNELILNGEAFYDRKNRENGADLTPGLRRRRERAERHKSFLKEQQDAAAVNGVLAAVTAATPNKREELGQIVTAIPVNVQGNGDSPPDSLVLSAGEGNAAPAHNNNNNGNGNNPSLSSPNLMASAANQHNNNNQSVWSNSNTNNNNTSNNNKYNSLLSPTKQLVGSNTISIINNNFDKNHYGNNNITTSTPSPNNNNNKLVGNNSPEFLTTKNLLMERNAALFGGLRKNIQRGGSVGPAGGGGGGGSPVATPAATTPTHHGSAGSGSDNDNSPTYKKYEEDANRRNNFYTRLSASPKKQPAAAALSADVDVPMAALTTNPIPQTPQSALAAVLSPRKTANRFEFPESPMEMYCQQAGSGMMDRLGPHSPGGAADMSCGSSNASSSTESPLTPLTPCSQPRSLDDPYAADVSCDFEVRPSRTVGRSSGGGGVRPESLRIVPATVAPPPRPPPPPPPPPPDWLRYGMIVPQQAFMPAAAAKDTTSNNNNNNHGKDNDGTAATGGDVAKEEEKVDEKDEVGEGAVGEIENGEKKQMLQLKRDHTVKDLTQKLSNMPMSPTHEEKQARFVGEMTGLISKAKEGLAKSKSKGEMSRSSSLDQELKKPDPKKSENELHWEELVRTMIRPLNLCDMDFTDLNSDDEKDVLAPRSLSVGVPPPPPPFASGPPPMFNPPPMLAPPPFLSYNYGGGPASLTNSVNSSLNGSINGELSSGNNTIRKNKKTVKLFWKEVREDLVPVAVGKTIWDELPPANVDTQKLEHLFESRAKDLMTKKQQELNKSKEVIVLDHKRSNAINIAMTKLPPPRAIKAAILKMDATVVTREGIEKLLNMLPTDEERGKIQEAQLSNPELPLGSAEQFLLTLASIAELGPRLKLWAFRLDFDNSEREIAEPLMDLKQGIGILRHNRTFRSILSTLLSVGIFLNGAPVKGFQIEYLSKVPEVKDTVHKHSLLHHLCHMVMESAADTTDLYSEIGPITRSSKADFADLAQNLTQLEIECKASWDRLKLIAKHDCPPPMKQKLVDFLADCAERIIILQIVHRRVVNRYRKFLLWLGVPQHSVAESKPNEFCRIVSEFALEYRTTRERVQQQLEKKANHRERNKTRGKLIIDMAKFKTKDDRADAELKQLLGTASPDTLDGTLTWRRRRAEQLRSPVIRQSEENFTDGDDEILESLVKTATKAPGTRTAPRERKRTRHADRKSLRRTLKNGLTEEEKQHVSALIQTY